MQVEKGQGLFPLTVNHLDFFDVLPIRGSYYYWLKTWTCWHAGFQLFVQKLTEWKLPVGTRRSLHIVSQNSSDLDKSEDVQKSLVKQGFSWRQCSTDHLQSTIQRNSLSIQSKHIRSCGRWTRKEIFLSNNFLAVVKVTGLTYLTCHRFGRHGPVQTAGTTGIQKKVDSKANTLLGRVSSDESVNKSRVKPEVWY